MKTYTQSESIARDYYNSSDADAFYYHVWGGEDIHVGIYDSVSNPSISLASQKTIDTMTSLYTPSSRDHILDIGSGYGGSARHLTQRFGCKVTCLNISEEQNQRNREKNKNLNLEDKIQVLDGSFERIPMEDSSVQLVWSQDAILHSSDKKKVFSEVYRVLKPGGFFIFTDPMQREGVSKEAIQPVLDRIHLEFMGSFDYYQRLGMETNFSFQKQLDLSKNLIYHYSSVLEELENRYQELLRENISSGYLDKMMVGLKHWIDAANKELISWGILLFRKPK